MSSQKVNRAGLGASPAGRFRLFPVEVPLTVPKVIIPRLLKRTVVLVALKSVKGKGIVWVALDTLPRLVPPAQASMKG